MNKSIDINNPKVTNGAAMAALLAAGIGSAVLGLMTVLVEASPNVIKPLLNFYNPVGPLSGKTTVAVLAYVFAWIVLAHFYHGKDVSEKKWLFFIFGFVGLGLLMTFPPFFELFAFHS